MGARIASKRADDRRSDREERGSAPRGRDAIPPPEPLGSRRLGTVLSQLPQREKGGVAGGWVRGGERGRRGTGRSDRRRGNMGEVRADNDRFA